ncbi:hypothetical protein LVD15_20910 [Fulvivirga maritima]|uniref:hypothetical protein n=1 Tax=Fulvivirga maritima TaxID=2904247 RepID=UPI001F266C28|nr:hypothetical protein [Fulvivirga maritima]UII25744.1 hypothetical protein LVD15_20910 [Fulvivirga maritima]
MNRVESYLYKRKFLKFTEAKLAAWNEGGCIDNLIFAAENGMFNIRYTCIKLLSSKLDQSKVKYLLITMIRDDVELVSEAAIEALKPCIDSNISKLIEEVRSQRKINKMAKNPYLSNIGFHEELKERPSDRLMNRLKEQQRVNHPPYF